MDTDLLAPHVCMDLAALSAGLDAMRRDMRVTRVPAGAAADWQLRDGALQHRTGGFFSISGVAGPAGPIVLMYQPQGAVTGLTMAPHASGPLVLLQARAEPGCLGGVQFGPTVQSTPANYLRLHGGSATPEIHRFVAHDSTVTLRGDSTQIDLGSRYLGKTKRLVHLGVPAPYPVQQGFVWASMPALVRAIGEDAFLNIDLRSLLALARWSAVPDGAALVPAAALIRKSLAAPIRPAAIGAAIAHPGAEPPLPRAFLPLDKLANWRQSDWGWAERQPVQGFGIAFFRTETAGREVADWVQPLIESQGQGRVSLALRERRGLAEVCITCADEPGLLRPALTATHVRSPGGTGADPDWLADAVPAIATIESDEGGRFFQDASRYEILRVDDLPAGRQPAGHWLRISEVKHLMAQSGLCTIQLRGVASHLLALGD